ncbi:adenine/guanine phosphoribosyltransferase-like PRPP-binding protein [Novosphingobium hassiacum]|uniref:Adenine/guanine phosphoribosyltransferase-like PRPP-binding protein n=1 Tax=Novosphingobium hassiacum TaxID=173676 RepID=A0A7W6EXH4_9SPHN|nr:hypothetical protein [Novosphingobium hassiacum]MBB3862382.1 adenine/guanine phosphoribosyltransferase-like PRPP-binding protein [Novosphingobium hassiacum]
MISATAATAEMARRLTEKAEAIAKAQAVIMTQRKNARRWRDAGLLWPLFGKD